MLATSESPVEIDPAELGWRRNLPPVPVGIVAAVTYRPGSPCGWPKTISKAEATALLLDNTIPMLKAPSRSLGAASKVTRQALCLAGARPEASRFARGSSKPSLLVMHDQYLCYSDIEVITVCSKRCIAPFGAKVMTRSGLRVGK